MIAARLYSESSVSVGALVQAGAGCPLVRRRFAGSGTEPVRLAGGNAHARGQELARCPMIVGPLAANHAAGRGIDHREVRMASASGQGNREQQRGAHHGSILAIRLGRLPRTTATSRR